MTAITGPTLFSLAVISRYYVYSGRVIMFLELQLKVTRQFRMRGVDVGSPCGVAATV